MLHIQVNGNLQVGYNGTGTASFSNGATFQGIYAFPGTNSSTSNGTLSLDGAGTTFYLNNDLHVGVTGTGTLAVTDGATESDVGNSLSGPTPARSVRRQSMVLARLGMQVLLFPLRDSGAGTLNITNGGNVSGGYIFGAFIGNNATGSRHRQRGSAPVRLLSVDDLWVGSFR